MRRISKIITQQNIFRSIALAFFVLAVSFLFFMAFLFATAAHARTLNQGYLCSVLSNEGHCYKAETILRQGEVVSGVESRLRNKV